MNRSEDSRVRQASRVVTAAARGAMAAEKARIAGKRTMPPSVLELAAQEAKVRNAKERFGMPHRVDTCPFSLQRVQLSDSGAEADGELCWELCNPLPEKRAATTVIGRANIAGVCALSRRLMAVERARALGKKPVDLQSWALELEARRWREERARRTKVGSLALTHDSPITVGEVSGG